MRGRHYSDETHRMAMWLHTAFGYGAHKISDWFRDRQRKGLHDEVPPAGTVHGWIYVGNETIERIREVNPTFRKQLEAA